MGRPSQPPPKPASDSRPRSSSKRPYHVAVAVGLSTGVYALSLAGVSILQFEHDRQLIAAREPVADAIAELATHHDRLTQRIEAVRGAYERAADRYGLVSDELRRLHDRLADLHGQVAAIEGAAGRLPTAISLPTVPQVKPAPAPVVAAPAPKSHAKTGASGGG
jgi:hypothetical protein